MGCQAATVAKKLPQLREERGREMKRRSEKNEFGTVAVRRLPPTFPRRCADAQLSRCSWPTDKWEKIVQFEPVVSSRRAALQINERPPQVWQEIFLKRPWETGPERREPLAAPSIGQARHSGRGDLAAPLLPGSLFLLSTARSRLFSPGLLLFFFLFLFLS